MGKKQNEVTFGYLDKISFRKKIQSDLEAAFNYPKYSAFSLSKDGAYAVVGLSKGGSGWQEYPSTIFRYDITGGTSTVFDWSGNNTCNRI